MHRLAQATLDGFVVPIEQAESWTKEGLLQKIIDFITECDQVRIIVRRIQAIY